MLTLFLWSFCVEEDVADPNIVGEGFNDFDDVFNNRPHNHHCLGKVYFPCP